MSDAREFADTDLLSAYLDGECTDAERAAVESRLAESAEWRAELDEVRSARDLLRSVADIEAPPGFWESVIAEVAADNVVSLDAKRRGPGRWIATAFAAAAAVALAVIVLPSRDAVSPDVTAVVVQHGARTADRVDPIGTIAPVGALGGFHR